MCTVERYEGGFASQSGFVGILTLNFRSPIHQNIKEKIVASTEKVRQSDPPLVLWLKFGPEGYRAYL